MFHVSWGVQRRIGVLPVAICAAVVLVGCEPPGGNTLDVTVDNQSGADVALLVGGPQGQSYVMPASRTSQTGVSEAYVPSLQLEVRQLVGCRLIGAYTMTPPGQWLITITPDGTAMVSSTSYSTVDLSVGPVAPGTTCLVLEVSP